MKHPHITPRRILVVDDEPYVCDALKLMLTVDGHQVTTASNGHEALEAFGKDKFDLVITDFSMPAMKGDELAATIKTRNPEQPIVMITAFVEMLSGAGTPLNGVDVLLSKPFRFEQLREAITKALAD